MIVTMLQVLDLEQENQQLQNRIVVTETKNEHLVVELAELQSTVVQLVERTEALQKQNDVVAQEAQILEAPSNGEADDTQSACVADETEEVEPISQPPNRDRKSTRLNSSH